MTKFCWFNLMPWPDLPDTFRQDARSVWVDIDQKYFDPAKANAVYHEYMDQLEYADSLGFDAIGVNEHHQNGYGIMPSPNIIAASLARRTSNAAIAVIGNSIALGFLSCVIQTKFFYDQILLRVTGTAQFNVSSEQVQSAKIPFPPIPEQAAIAAYLDLETAKLDALVGKVEEAVERLQEYRTALITAAVTGKIDVRKAVAHVA